MRWLLYAPLQCLCALLCYLTNWAVVLFADEQGELPGLLRLWQTWDDTLDNETDIGRMPKWLQYDWKEHYIQGQVMERGQTRYTEELIKPFTWREKLKRYCCRCHWLYRNNAYGFAYYVFGREIYPAYSIKADTDRYMIFDSVGNWAYKDQTPMRFGHWKIYLGWKIQRTLGRHRAMIATRIWFSK
jgi:hypothetical protein